MPYRPEAELKRPDLKGEFLCGHCGKTFCHAASLNRHRLNFHGDDQECLICNEKIPKNDTVRRHMLVEHKIPRVFTCGCCNWTFPDKKELHAHNNSMLKTRTPGGAKAIAVSSRAPGSLSQHELRGEERVEKPKKKSGGGATKKAVGPLPKPEEQLLAVIAQMLGTNPSEPSTSTAPVLPAIPALWLSQLLAANPLLAPFIPPTAPSTTSLSEVENVGTPEPVSGLDGVLETINNNEQEAENAQEEADKDFLVQSVGADFLSVHTERATSGSGGSDSGLGATPSGSFTPSPVASGNAAEILQNIIKKAKKAEKRRSIDDICKTLRTKRSC